VQAEERQRHTDREHGDRGDGPPAVAGDEAEGEVDHGEQNNQHCGPNEYWASGRRTAESEDAQRDEGKHPQGRHRDSPPASGTIECSTGRKHPAEQTEQGHQHEPDIPQDLCEASHRGSSLLHFEHNDEACRHEDRKSRGPGVVRHVGNACADKRGYEGRIGVPQSEDGTVHHTPFWTEMTWPVQVGLSLVWSAVHHQRPTWPHDVNLQCTW
jgi:hypothetical protein